MYLNSSVVDYLMSRLRKPPYKNYGGAISRSIKLLLKPRGFISDTSDSLGFEEPTFPPFFWPKNTIGTTKTMVAKQAQKAAWYPLSKDSSMLSPFCSCCCVTAEEMAAVTARPTELPTCAKVPKTPPARDWDCCGNARAIMREEAVNRTMSR